jgi:hypothetical protein
MSMHDQTIRTPSPAFPPNAQNPKNVASGSLGANPSAGVSSKAIDPDKLYSTKETAVLLNMSGSWLAKGRLSGDGPRYVKLGRAVKYQGRDIIEYLKSKKRHSTSE